MKCCWTHCDNPQGVGTWTEINGETLPVCEEHWYGNLDRERRQLRAEVERLREKVTTLKGQLTGATRSLHDKNLLLDALHMVWCDGSCMGGVHRYTDQPVTEELVALAERNTTRLRRWFNGVRWRQTPGNYPTTSEFHRLYLERAAVKVPHSDTPDNALRGSATSPPSAAKDGEA